MALPVTYPLVSYDPKAPQRSREHQSLVAQILNSLIARGDIFRVGETTVWRVGGGLVIRTVTGDVTAVAGDLVIVDASASDRTVTLPADPSLGDQVGVVYGTGADSNIVTIARNGETINGLTDDLVLYVYPTMMLDGTSDYLEVVFDGTTWRVLTDERISHRAMMCRTAIQGIAHATTTKVNLDTEVFDIGAIADPTTAFRFVIRRAGNYQLEATVRMNNPSVWQRRERLFLQVHTGSGVTEIANAEVGPGPDEHSTVGLSQAVELAAGDDVELRIFQSSGGALDTETGMTTCPQLAVMELR